MPKTPRYLTDRIGVEAIPTADLLPCTLLKPDTFYFMRWRHKTYRYDDLMICKTDEEAVDPWVYDIDEDTEKGKHFPFYVLGHISCQEYAWNYPEEDWEFIEIPRPANYVKIEHKPVRKGTPK